MIIYPLYSRSIMPKVVNTAGTYIYGIIPTSALYVVYTRLGKSTTQLTLHELVADVTCLLREGGHFDEHNDFIVLCNQEWENIFGMKALHVKQIEAALKKSLYPLAILQLSLLPPTAFPPYQDLQQKNRPRFLVPKALPPIPAQHLVRMSIGDTQITRCPTLTTRPVCPTRITPMPPAQHPVTLTARSAGPPMQCCTNRITLSVTLTTLSAAPPDQTVEIAAPSPPVTYHLSPNLLDLFRTANVLNPRNQMLFTESDAIRVFCAYIIKKQHLIFDKRNICVALVGSDPLGPIFNVTAFHRDQSLGLLRKHLIPVPVPVMEDLPSKKIKLM